MDEQRTVAIVEIDLKIAPDEADDTIHGVWCVGDKENLFDATVWVKEVDGVEKPQRYPIDEEKVKGAGDRAFEAAMRALRKGPPGVLRNIVQNDSAPPDYAFLPTTGRDERQAVADIINAYVANSVPAADYTERIRAENSRLQNELEDLRQELTDR